LFSVLILFPFPLCLILRSFILLLVCRVSGECDAGDNGNYIYHNKTQYLSDILPMIAAFRNTSFLNFTSAELPFVVGNMLPSWMFDKGLMKNETRIHRRSGVYEAITQLAQLVPFTGQAPSQGLQGDLKYLSGLDGEVIHFTAASQRIFGRRYFAAWQMAKFNAPDPVIPVAPPAFA